MHSWRPFGHDSHAADHDLEAQRRQQERAEVRPPAQLQPLARFHAMGRQET